MKKFLLAAALALFVSVAAFAQNPPGGYGPGAGSSSATPTPGVFNSNFDPPLFQNYSLSSTGAQAGINLSATPIDTHTLAWRPVGTVSTCAIQLDTSPDNVNWTAAGAIASQGCTASGQATSVQGLNANYVRVNLTTLTGGGTLTVIYSGRLSPAPAMRLPAIPTVTTQSQPFLQQSFETCAGTTATMGSNWAVIGTGMQRASGKCEPGATGGIEDEAFVATIDQGWPADQCASITLAAHANNNTYGDAAVRINLNGSGQSGVSTPAGGYFWGAFNGSGTVTLWKLIANGAFSLATGGSVTVGHIYMLCAVGEPSPPLGRGTGVVLTGYDNGSVSATFTDTSATAIAAGAYGMLAFATTAVTDIQFSSWGGGAAISAPTVNAFSQIIPGTNSNLGTITGSGQAVQFVLPSPSLNGLGTLQLVVSPGVPGSGNSVNAPVWQLTATQDGGQSWFPVPCAVLQNGGMGGNGSSLYAPYCNISGLSGSTVFQFQLRYGTVNGTLTVYGAVN